MTDVFISYAREDYTTASRLAEAFEHRGWSVWWDHKILTGQAFDRAIELQLESAKSVVVLWSRHSIESEWVKNEAAAAMERGVLAPASIESVKLPLEFRRKQTADLSGWNGEVSHEGFQSLCEGIASQLGAKIQPEEKPVKSAGIRYLPSLVVVLAIALGLVIYWVSFRRAQSAGGNAQQVEAQKPGGLADLVVGTYDGDVIADAKAGGRSDVRVTVQKIDRNKVRVTSNYDRIGAFSVDLTRASGTDILNLDGDTVFHVYLNQGPRKLELAVHNEISYAGTSGKPE